MPVYFSLIPIKRADSGSDTANKTEVKDSSPNFASNIGFPILKKLHFKSLCMTTSIGVQNNAAATAMALAGSRLAYDIVFSVMSQRNLKMKLCRELVPVYDKTCIKTEITGIFIISLANIIKAMITHLM